LAMVGRGFNGGNGGNGEGGNGEGGQSSHLSVGGAEFL
jgi:hypothetical protein